MIKTLRISLAAAGFAVLLAACTTPLAADTAFGPQSGTAMLVLAGPIASAAETIELQRVDLASSKFEADVVTPGNGGIDGNRMNGDTKGPTWLSPMVVTAGDYALIGTYISTFNGVSSGTKWRCMFRGAPVYALTPGSIGIVRAESYSLGAGAFAASRVSDEAVMQEFTEARKKFPNIVGEARIVPPSAMIGFEAADFSLFSNNSSCSPKPDFQRLK